MAEEWKKGWKVITKRARRSCTWKSRFSWFAYPPREIVKRHFKCGPLAVFTDKLAAGHFIESNDVHGAWTIVECLYLPSEDNYLWETKKRGKHIWEDVRRRKAVPYFTAFADAVQCLE